MNPERSPGALRRPTSVCVPGVRRSLVVFCALSIPLLVTGIVLRLPLPVADENSWSIVTVRACLLGGTSWILLQQLARTADIEFPPASWVLAVITGGFVLFACVSRFSLLVPTPWGAWVAVATAAAVEEVLFRVAIPRILVGLSSGRSSGRRFAWNALAILLPQAAFAVGHARPIRVLSPLSGPIGFLMLFSCGVFLFSLVRQLGPATAIAVHAGFNWAGLYAVPDMIRFGEWSTAAGWTIVAFLAVLTMAFFDSRQERRDSIQQREEAYAHMAES